MGLRIKIHSPAKNTQPPFNATLFCLRIPEELGFLFFSLVLPSVFRLKRMIAQIIVITGQLCHKQKDLPPDSFSPFGQGGRLISPNQSALSVPGWDTTSSLAT